MKHGAFLSPSTTLIFGFDMQEQILFLKYTTSLFMPIFYGFVFVLSMVQRARFSIHSIFSYLAAECLLARLFIYILFCFVSLHSNKFCINNFLINSICSKHFMPFSISVFLFMLWREWNIECIFIKRANSACSLLNSISHEESRFHCWCKCIWICSGSCIMLIAPRRTSQRNHQHKMNQ